MRIDIISPFPEIAIDSLKHSIIGRAQSKKLVQITGYNLRDWGMGKHQIIDDTPYGGGCGMVLKIEPIFNVVESIKTQESKIIVMSAQGKPFKQLHSKQLSGESHLIFICGHYEGIDHRVIEYLADEEFCIGDYILTNGALSASVIIDSIIRLIPGVLGDENSNIEESFSNPNLIEHPSYTRPQHFKGMEVPEVLSNGNHEEIKKWKSKQARLRQQQLRPDLSSEDT